MQVYIASDFATKPSGGDYTVHLALGCDPLGDLWILDMWRQQADTADIMETQAATCRSRVRSTGFQSGR
jgi:hypothetical protein